MIRIEIGISQGNAKRPADDFSESYVNEVEVGAIDFK